MMKAEAEAAAARAKAVAQQKAEAAAARAKAVAQQKEARERKQKEAEEREHASRKRVQEDFEKTRAINALQPAKYVTIMAPMDEGKPWQPVRVGYGSGLHAYPVTAATLWALQLRFRSEPGQNFEAATWQGTLPRYKADYEILEASLALGKDDFGSDKLTNQPAKALSPLVPSMEFYARWVGGDAFLLWTMPGSTDANLKELYKGSQKLWVGWSAARTRLQQESWSRLVPTMSISVRANRTEIEAVPPLKRWGWPEDWKDKVPWWEYLYPGRMTETQLVDWLREKQKNEGGELGDLLPNNPARAKWLADHPKPPAVPKAGDPDEEGLLFAGYKNWEHNTIMGLRPELAYQSDPRSWFALDQFSNTSEHDKKMMYRRSTEYVKLAEEMRGRLQQWEKEWAEFDKATPDSNTFEVGYLAKLNITNWYGDAIGEWKRLPENVKRLYSYARQKVEDAIKQRWAETRQRYQNERVRNMGHNEFIVAKASGWL